MGNGNITVASSTNTCIVCRLTIVQKFKICTNNTAVGATRWKLFPLESLCLLFGFSLDHPLIGALLSERELINQLCNRCFEDLSNIHYIFWQLHNLETKLAQLQKILFQRLKDNYNNITVSERIKSEVKVDLNENDNEGWLEYDNVVRSLFEEFKLGERTWPKSTYGVNWKKTKEYVTITGEQVVNLDEEKSSSRSFLATEEKHENLQPKEEKLEYPDVDDSSHIDDVLNCFDNYNDDVDCDHESEQRESKNGEKISDVQRRTRQKNTLNSKRREKKINSIQRDRATHNETLSPKFICAEDPDICSRTFYRRKDLNLHIKQFHKGRTHICDFEGCVHKFLSKGSLIKHKIRKHGLEKPKTFRCMEDRDICSRVYSTKRDLKEHVKGFHLGRTHICDHEGCTENFLSSARLSQHKTKSHGYEGLNVEFRICEICGTSVNSKHMTAHFRSRHLGHSKFTCERCFMNFSDIEQLQTHEHLHDQSADSLPFTCVVSDCRTVCSCSQDLKSHVINQHVTNWLKCEVCGVTKPNEFILKAHLKVHGRVKNVICDECPKAFFSKSALQTHKRDYHMGNKYTCNICAKEYTLKKSYDRHVTSHQDEKTIKCSVCPKSFNTKESLKKHEQVHSGCKNYECKLCGKKFKTAQNLRQHLNTQFHKGVPPKQIEISLDETIE